MKYSLQPYISFKGQAREAMTFYQSVFGGRLDIVPFTQFDIMYDLADGVMHSALVIDDETFIMGSDDMEAETPAGIALSLGGSSDDLRELFTKLSDGATSVHELATEQWGDEYGELVDKYGVRWMFNSVSEKA